MKIELNGKDITKLVEKLNLTNSIESLSTTASLTLASFKDTSFLVDVKVGDKLIIDDVLTGIVVDVTYNKNSTDINVFDISFYLSKNHILKQFRNTTSKAAINSICSELGIKVNVKSGLDTKINLMFKNKSASDCINEIIKENQKITAKVYFIYVKNNTLIIEELGSEKINITYKLNEDLTFKNDEVFSEKVINENIEELKNSIIVVSDDNKAIKILSKKDDETSIKKFGKLQTVVELNSKENKSASKVANVNLSSLNKIKKNLTVKVISDNYIISGKKISLDNKDYLIKSVNLDFVNNSFQGSLELKELI